MQTRMSFVPRKKPARQDTFAPSQDRVAAVAYQILLSQGYQEGHHLDLWLEAEARLRSGPPVNQRTW
jgi:hypothetical protein